MSGTDPPPRFPAFGEPPADDPAPPPSTADITRQYIDDHPSIREALLEDLVNFTALARKIQAERELRNEEAVTVACRRYQRNLLSPDAGRGAIRAVLQVSRLQVHTRVALLRIRDEPEMLDRLYEAGRTTLPGPPGHRMFQIFQGTRAITVLCDEHLLGIFTKVVPERLLIEVERNLASLWLKSRPESAETPGVVAHLVESLYSRGINTLETVSVHTDSIFVFREDDALEAFRVLTALLGPEPAKEPAELRR